MRVSWPSWLECEKYVGIFCGILPVPHNIVMDMNDVNIIVCLIPPPKNKINCNARSDWFNPFTLQSEAKRREEGNKKESFTTPTMEEGKSS